MGNHSSNNPPGHESSLNGHDSFYHPTSWRDNIIDKKPKRFNTWRFITLFSLDFYSLFILLGLVDRLTTSKEVIALFVGILYLVVRITIILLKAFVFIGKNSEHIKKGVKSLKEIIKD